MSLWSALKKRYGRSSSHHLDSLAYRGFELRVRLSEHFYAVDIMKPTIAMGMRLEETVEAPTRKEAIGKAKRMVDAMRGD